jgi:hypothetical protein
MPSAIPYSSARRPYQSFSGITMTTPGGSSIYHGLTIQADRRVGRSLLFNVNYTWAKALSDVDLRSTSPGSQQNQYNRSLERADDPNIRRQTLRFNYLYDLPVGRGKALLPSWARSPTQSSAVGSLQGSPRCTPVRA